MKVTSTIAFRVSLEARTFGTHLPRCLLFKHSLLLKNLQKALLLHLKINYPHLMIELVLQDLKYIILERMYNLKIENKFYKAM